MNNYHRIMEKFWLVVAILTFVFGVYKVGQVGLRNALMYLAFPALAAGMFYARYYARKRFEDKEKNN